MTAPRLISIQVGTPREHGDASSHDSARRAWKTGFFKSPVAGPVVVGRVNLAGDGQADLENHGGPDKAVCAYSADHYPYWRERLAAAGVAADAVTPGAFGENFTAAGLGEADVCVGDIWRVREGRGARGAGGESADNGMNGQRSGATFQISQPRQPCWKLARRWGVKTLAADVIATGKTGWYFRVVEEGVVAAGMEMTLIERPFPEWTVERANWVMHHDKRDREAAAQLAAVAALSESWRDDLSRRLAGR